MNGFPSPGDELARRLRYMWRELKVLADRIAALSRRVKVLEDAEPPKHELPPEMPVHHQRGAVVAEESDPYPVVLGGEATITVQLRVAPTTAVTIEVRRNGVTIGTPIVIAAGVTGLTRRFTEVFRPGDLYTDAVTDEGTGAEGLVVVGQFRRYA